jgi:hypothetical protein
MSDKKFYGSQEYYNLLEQGVIRHCKTVISVDGRKYKAELENWLSLVGFDRVMTKPEWILEEKEWIIEE